MSEVIPEDEDRGGDGAMEGAVGGIGEAPGATTDDGDDNDNDGGSGADDGGPGSQNM